MEQSYWYSDPHETYPAVKKSLRCDTAVIGGGVAGLSAALELLRRGHSVCVLEASLVGSGQTGRASALVTFAHDLIYDRLIKKHGERVARQYLELQRGGLETVKDNIRSYGIDCGWRDADMVLYTRLDKNVKKLEAEREAYARLGCDFELTRKTELPFAVAGALEIPRQGCMDPYRYALGLAAAVAGLGGQIFENTQVDGQPKNGQLSVNGCTVTARRFIVATHYPYLKVPGFYFAKLYQHRSHNIVFSGFPPLANLYEEVEEDGFEYRPADDGILSGGANVRTGKYRHRSQYDIVELAARRRFGEQARIVCRFSAQDCMTYDMLPMVGSYGTLKDVFVITGFNKWGFTNSAACAKLAADCVEGRKTQNVFDSRRLYLVASPIAAAKNMGEVLGNYVQLALFTDSRKLDRIAPRQGALVKYKGKRLGIYRDENGELHAVQAVCPHLGCGLKWNKDELSWDCPCHGSRFDVDGNLLNNPALRPLSQTRIQTPDQTPQN